MVVAGGGCSGCSLWWVQWLQPVVGRVVVAGGGCSGCSLWSVQ